jgi:zinc transport system substrate-binding protein
MASSRYFLATLAAAALASPAWAGSPDVVVSIKPIHSLVAGVMQGVGEPTLLVEGAGSPHTYTLRPSEARAIAQADVVFWVGEGLETFLAGPLKTLAPDARLVALGTAPGIELLPARSGGMWQEPRDEDEGEHAGDHAHHENASEETEHAGAEHGHRHRAGDMHVWLDPQNAKAMVDAIAVALAETDPENAAAYEDNAARLRKELDRLDHRLVEVLAPVDDRPYVVFHDGYQYFERRYGLNAVGADPRCAPGERRGLRVRRAAVRACVGRDRDRGQLGPLRRARSAGRSAGRGTRSVLPVAGKPGGLAG